MPTLEDCTKQILKGDPSLGRLLSYRQDDASGVILNFGVDVVVPVIQNTLLKAVVTVQPDFSAVESTELVAEAVIPEELKP